MCVRARVRACVRARARARVLLLFTGATGLLRDRDWDTPQAILRLHSCYTQAKLRRHAGCTQATQCTARRASEARPFRAYKVDASLITKVDSLRGRPSLPRAPRFIRVDGRAPAAAARDVRSVTRRRPAVPAPGAAAGEAAGTPAGRSARMHVTQIDLTQGE